jgi:hypothetical protein
MSTAMHRRITGAIALAVLADAADSCISTDRVKAGTIASNAMQTMQSLWFAEFIFL